MRQSKNNSTRIHGKVIPRHKVNRNDLFTFDHYESTTLTITPEEIRLVDNYFRKTDENNSPDSAIFEIIVNQKESIERLLQYFDINGSKNEDMPIKLYQAMENYAR